MAKAEPGSFSSPLLSLSLFFLILCFLSLSLYRVPFPVYRTTRHTVTKPETSFPFLSSPAFNQAPWFVHALSKKSAYFFPLLLTLPMTSPAITWTTIESFQSTTPHPAPRISTLHAGARGIFLSVCIIAVPKTHWWMTIISGMNSQVPNRVDRLLRWCIWSPFRYAFHPALQVITPPSHVLGDIFALLTLRLQASAKTSCVQVHLLTLQISFFVVQLLSHV